METRKLTRFNQCENAAIGILEQVGSDFFHSYPLHLDNDADSECRQKTESTHSRDWC